MNGKGVYANSEIELEGIFENDNFVRPLNWSINLWLIMFNLKSRRSHDWHCRRVSYCNSRLKSRDIYKRSRQVQEATSSWIHCDREIQQDIYLRPISWILHTCNGSWNVDCLVIVSEWHNPLLFKNYSFVVNCIVIVTTWSSPGIFDHSFFIWTVMLKTCSEKFSLSGLVITL